MKEITARLWENKMYGTTFGKGQYRKAIYNGTLEIPSPYAKYLVDFEEVEAWFHFPKSPVHVEMANRLKNIPTNEDGVLMSWIYRYENGAKTAVAGYSALDMNCNKITIQIDDSAHGINEYWELPVRSCIARVPGKPTPALIATTQSELNSPQKLSTNGVFAGGHKGADIPFFHTDHRLRFSPNGLCVWFHQLYKNVGISGGSSHSGRKFFITTLANKGIGVRIIASLAGHRSIAVTQRYIDVNDEQKRNAVELI